MVLRRGVVLLVLVVGVLLGLSACDSDDDGAPPPFALNGTQRVYDESGDSLSLAQRTSLEQAVTRLHDDTGADVVLYVRTLQADPDQTLDQVEQLQQAWATRREISADTAVAILVNRAPGSPDDARAGIFVGATYDDGNVPRREQEAIVSDALLPPLREGDVAASLSAGLRRFADDVRNGPPSTSAQRLADGAGSTWLPWTLLGVSLAGLAVLVPMRPRRRQALRVAPTTTRPDRATTPALAGALVAGRASAHAIPATILALGTRGALTIEQEDQAGRWRSGSVQVRLLDGSLVRGEVEQAMWSALEEEADDGLLRSAALGDAARGALDVRIAVTEHLREHGWLAERSLGSRVTPVVLGVLGVLVAAGSIGVLANGAPLMAAPAVAAVVLVLAAWWTTVRRPRLSVAGLEAAAPWVGYRDGLRGAVRERPMGVDLASVLPDVVALGLAKKLDDDVEVSLVGHSGFLWGSFSDGVYSSGGGGAGSIVSGGGSGGGGGGAAGST